MLFEKENERNSRITETVKANSIETSLKIVESIQNGETNIEENKRGLLENIYTEKILELLPEDVDALSIGKSEKIIREEGYNKDRPLIWGRDEIKKYIKKLKKKGL